jgi:Zn-dependent protease
MTSDFSVAKLLIWFVVFAFSTTFHEFGHSAIAYLGGDKTAYEGGQVSLDPLPHMRREPFGMVVVPLLSYFMGGWMIGWASAPFDPRWAQRNPSKYAMMSAAGPAANFILAIVAFAIISVLLGLDVFQFSGAGIDEIVVAPGNTPGAPLGALAMALSVLLSLNILLGVFNLMPIPPLDGSAVVEGLFPEQAGGLYQKMRSTPGFGFLGLIVAWKLFPYLGGPVLSAVILALS